jgi:hypothetical protein
MVVVEGYCEVDRVVILAKYLGIGLDGTKTTFGMERIADMEDYKSARAVRSETQGGGYPRSDVDKGNKGGEK